MKRNVMIQPITIKTNMEKSEDSSPIPSPHPFILPNALQTKNPPCCDFSQAIKF